jgi:hypothetical protein
MAVTFDAVGPSSGGLGLNPPADPQTWSHTCSGSNRLLVVGVSVSNDSATLTCSYNSVSMTSAGKIHSNNQNAGFVQMFYLANPDAGTYNVSVSGQGTSTYFIAGSISFNGVNQSTPIRNNATNYGSGDTPTITITSATDNMVVDLCGLGNTIYSYPQTERWWNNYTAMYGCGNIVQSTAVGSSSVTMSYTGNSDWWGIVAMDIIADSGSPVQIQTLAAMGVGPITR